MHPDKQMFFEDLATRWDTMVDGAAVQARLRQALPDLAIDPDETVMDVGCGTGNLTAVLLDHLSARGRVIAVDVAAAMIEAARAKLSDARVRWRVADIEQIDEGLASVDRVICFSAWPHFDRPEATARHILTLLKPGGYLHIWHIDSREKINGIHTRVGGQIAHDLLPPATAVGDLLTATGFDLTTCEENGSHYLVSVQKPAV